MSTNPFQSIALLSPTPSDWVPTALKDFDAFLLDHASCERKASAVGMSFVVRYPDRTLILDPMIQFAREELEHFHQVYRLIEARGLQLGEDTEDVYVGGMMKLVRTGRDERFLDRLLVSGVIEARGAERLNLVARHFREMEPEDASLTHFYTRLARAEERHQSFFLELAALYFDAPTIDARLKFFLEAEHHAISRVPHRSALH